MLDSQMEIKIHEVLEQSGLPFVEEYSFPDLTGRTGIPLRFDFAVLNDLGEVDFLIEAQGRQHYVAVKDFGGKRANYRQKHNDNLKRKYCLKNNLKLITIPYWDEGSINYDYIMRAAGY